MKKILIKKLMIPIFASSNNMLFYQGNTGDHGIPIKIPHRMISSSSPKQSQLYPKPIENPPAYRPNILNRSPKPLETPTSAKPKIMCHKYGLGNHYVKACLANVPYKLKVKDSTYYAHRAQEQAESENAFLTKIL